MKKFHIKKGDTVYVNAGNDKGTTGKVLSVLRDKDRVIVEGVNMVSKHTKPNAKHLRAASLNRKAAFTFQTCSFWIRRKALLRSQCLQELAISS